MQREDAVGDGQFDVQLTLGQFAHVHVVDEDGLRVMGRGSGSGRGRAMAVTQPGMNSVNTRASEKHSSFTLFLKQNSVLILDPDAEHRKNHRGVMQKRMIATNAWQLAGCYY